ncbi:MAG: type I 3-dehydroquinate dehydratase [Planctomycetota bacterium]
MTLVCVPIMVDDIGIALADARTANDTGADIVELRIDSYFPGSEGDSEDRLRIESLRGLIAECPLPVILTCRSAEEGGDYDGDEVDRVSLLEKLCVNVEHPPAYLDFELAAYQRSANIRQKVNLCVDHPKQQRDVRTRLILSMHDFDQRPSDLMRRLADAWAEPAASVVKFAYRCRSIRDNLEIFEILRDAPKPTIGLGMGEFGLMSRVLAPKFGGFLTFASLRDSAATAPGQPTISDLLGMYRIRSIGRDTRVYGVIGWPVTQSMSPLIHNAGFEARGWDGVYLPMPVAADTNDIEISAHSVGVTINQMMDARQLNWCGASVTIPFKEAVDHDAFARHVTRDPNEDVIDIGAANTLAVRDLGEGYPIVDLYNTDATAISGLLEDALERVSDSKVVVIGAGGVALAAGHCVVSRGGKLVVAARRIEQATALVERLNGPTVWDDEPGGSFRGTATAIELGDLFEHPVDVYINCTPVGMAGGPDPEGLSIPVHDLAGKLPPETVFFDTVYNPIETPMLRAAREHGFRTIDGVEMFVRQAAAQFELWTGEQAPMQLFDRLVRERLGG